jgi:hypothetical protein
VEMSLTNDPRLVSGVTCAVEYFAALAGFNEATCKALVEAAAQACEDTFQLLTDDAANVRVIIEDYSDRIEITLQHRGEALPSAGLDTFGIAGLEGAQSGLALLSRVDRVQYHTEGGVSEMKLVKYHPASASQH